MTADLCRLSGQMPMVVDPEPDIYSKHLIQEAFQSRAPVELRLASIISGD